MPFKHLFIFPSHQVAKVCFFTRLEERARYTSRPMGGYRRISMWERDGEHEIFIGTVDDIGDDRLRGMYFDKVSIHETVELDWHIHHFLQQHRVRPHRSEMTFRGMKVIVDPHVPEDKVYVVNGNFVANPKHIQELMKYEVSPRLF